MTAPERPSTTWDLPATDDQVAFLISLAAERGIEYPPVSTRGEASEAIDCLRAMPRKPRSARPFVSIQPVVVVLPDDETGCRVARLDGLLHVRCSACGPLSEWEMPDDDEAQRDLRREAAEHAVVAHGGEVDALGWTPAPTGPPAPPPPCPSCGSPWDPRREAACRACGETETPGWESA